MDYWTIDDLPREKLLELVMAYGKNCMAMDGLWFQALEKKYDMAEAMAHDVTVWKQYAIIEAKRIKALLELPDNAGLEGLNQALRFRSASLMNTFEYELDGDVLRYRGVNCRIQTARKEKGLGYHPCKDVGIVEQEVFARAIDARIATRCISCHPDVTVPEYICVWEFYLEEG